MHYLLIASLMLVAALAITAAGASIHQHVSIARNMSGQSENLGVTGAKPQTLRSTQN
jgi:hypothetical protein